jgi:hypothetical protein
MMMELGIKKRSTATMSRSIVSFPLSMFRLYSGSLWESRDYSLSVFSSLSTRKMPITEKMLMVIAQPVKAIRSPVRISFMVLLYSGSLEESRVY